MSTSLKKRWWLLFWALASWLGVILSVLTMCLLYVYLDLSGYGRGEDWFYLSRVLMFCGATQGLVLGTFQGVALWKMRFIRFQKMLCWLGITVVSMAVGMALPIAWVSSDIVGSWLLSWLLAGLLLGALVGRCQYQKVGFALINAGAYLIWGLAPILGAVMLIATLDHVSVKPVAWIGCGLLVTLMLAVGTVLNSVVLLFYLET